MLKAGVDFVFSNNLFERLVTNLGKERLDIQILILRACYNCIRRGEDPIMPYVAIECHALEAFCQLARDSTIVEVQVLSCECIMMLWLQLS